MGGCSPLAKCCLVSINIFFLVVGLAFFGLGLFVRFGSSVINGYVDSVKDSIQESVNSISSFGTIDLSNIDLTEILLAVALTLIFLGLFLAIVSFLGCCGSCCNVKCMLTVYIVISCVILVGQIVFVGILYGSPDTIHDPVKKELRKKIQSKYAGLDGTDTITVAWNVVMQKGCYGKIKDSLIGNSAIVIGAMTGIFVIQLVLILFALILVCSGDNAKKNKVEPHDTRGKPPPYSKGRPAKNAVQPDDVQQGLNF